MLLVLLRLLEVEGLLGLAGLTGLLGRVKFTGWWSLAKGQLDCDQWIVFVLAGSSPAMLLVSP